MAQMSADIFETTLREQEVNGRKRSQWQRLASSFSGHQWYVVLFGQHMSSMISEKTK